MINEVLKKVLQLDSLCNLLSWYERVTIHQLLRDKNQVEISEKIALLIDWIEKVKWECPGRAYEDDRILYFFDPNSKRWYSSEFYLKLNYTYYLELTKISNKKL